MSTTLETRPTVAPATPAPPAAPRMDFYAAIHKALRSLMADTLLRAGRLEVFDADEMARTLGQVDGLLHLCTQHLRHENTFIHPALEACRPGSAGRVEAEHEQHLQHIAALRDEVQRLRRGDDASRPLLAQRLYRHLGLFVADNLQHMHVEETAHNALLWAHYSDAELTALHDRLLASVPFDEFLQVARWMLPALNPQERAGLLGDMQAGMPPAAFEAVLAAARPHLDETAWGRLARGLGLPPQPGLVDCA